jgi:hypothetical protein
MGMVLPALRKKRLLFTQERWEFSNEANLVALDLAGDNVGSRNDGNA